MTTTNTFAATTIVAFHIGRGGRFHNAGHLSYIGQKKIGEFTENLFLSFENAWSVGKKIGDRENLRKKLEDALDAQSCDSDAYLFLSDIGLDLGELVWTDGGGNFVGLTLEEEESGVGCINIDNDYDKTYCCYLCDCSEQELQLIYDAISDSYYPDYSLLEYAKEQLGISEDVE